MRYLFFSVLLFVAACDSGNDTLPCALETDDIYTFSTPFSAQTGENIALFEFQQEVQVYERGDCTAQEDVNEVSLVVRNLTACVLSLNYSASLISNGDGWTIEGNATVQPDAAADQGIVQRNGPIIISNAQAVLTGASTLTACP